MGSTAWAAAQALAARGVTIWAVDLWGGSPEIGWSPEQWDLRWRCFVENMRDAGLEGTVRVMKLPSVEAASHFPIESLDLIFLDADHRREYVLADIVAWWPKLKPGGVLYGHDYCAQRSGVIQAVDESFGKPDELSGGDWKVWVVRKTAGREPAIPRGGIPVLSLAASNYFYRDPTAQMSVPRQMAQKPKSPLLPHGFAA